MDLLVWRPVQKEPIIWNNFRVEFLHRTVADYLQTETARAKVRAIAGGNFDTRWYVVNALVVALSATRAYTPETPGNNTLRKWRPYWFENILSALSNTDSKHLTAGYSYLAQASEHLLESVATGVATFVAPRVDDAKLALAIFCGLPGYFLWCTSFRDRFVSRDYCLHYLGPARNNFEICDRPEPRMLAAILRRTERSPSAGDKIARGRFHVPGRLPNSDAATAFGLAFTEDIRDLAFSSNKERKDFSAFVEHILLELCAQNRETVRQHLADAQKSWTVGSKSPWSFGVKRLHVH